MRPYGHGTDRESFHDPRNYVGRRNSEGTSFEILMGKQRFDLSDAGWKYLKPRVSRKAPKLVFPDGFLEELKDEEAKKI